MAYRIFTDATADLNDELLRGLPKVEVIPMEIISLFLHYSANSLCIIPIILILFR